MSNKPKMNAASFRLLFNSATNRSNSLANETENMMA